MNGPVSLPVQVNGHGQSALLTAATVHNQVFSVVRLRSGYDLAEVDDFLARVETTLSRLWQDNAHLRERLAAGPAVPPGSADELAAAEQTAQETITAAQREAHQILA
ncbi:DivIVA domain-containing protein, partial [Nonomuraea sp. NPDC049784]|uniref:DivIVA domain-containing protein n=1 Tax=Nonomuraea sp. NPDC049784 TaxID=3154361 RepID=UPI0033F51FD3